MELVFCPNNLSYSRIHSIFSPFLHKTYAIRNVLQTTEWLVHIKLIKSTTNYWGCEREFSRLHIYIAKEKKKKKKIQMIFHVEFLHFRNRSTLVYKFCEFVSDQYLFINYQINITFLESYVIKKRFLKNLLLLIWKSFYNLAQLHFMWVSVVCIKNWIYNKKNMSDIHEILFSHVNVTDIVIFLLFRC